MDKPDTACPPSGLSANVLATTSTKPAKAGFVKSSSKGATGWMWRGNRILPRASDDTQARRWPDAPQKT
jgi:hypothetical protein